MPRPQIPSNCPPEGLSILIQAMVCPNCTTLRDRRPIHHGEIHVVSHFASTLTQPLPSPSRTVALQHEYFLPSQTESTFSGEVLEEFLQTVLPLFRQELETRATFAPSCQSSPTSESPPDYADPGESLVHSPLTLSTAYTEDKKGKS